jgi:transcriptional repressor NrdR
VAERLRRVDQVAYVRFASVYRQFKTLEELVDEAKAVIDAKRFEDPTQGKLFLESQAAASNGAPSKPKNQRNPQSVVKTQKSGVVGQNV